VTVLDSDTSPKLKRQSTVEALRLRDGDTCQYPGCDEILDFTILDDNNPFFVTIDHHMPKWWCNENGWSHQEIWDISNLRLMTKHCNARKGDLIPNEDGTLPEKPAKRKFRYRRQKRATRPEICEFCQAGRMLGENEWCNACGAGPNPGRYQKWRQMRPTDCDHDLFYCVACTVWFPEYRRSVLDTLISGGDGYE
jgi:hypothetical protein